MKARYLVSCILLPILVILIFSTAAQATEYREVNATEILTKIENGEDVNYTDCQIVGELNLSSIELKTVPNPYYSQCLNEGYTEQLIIFYEINENISLIESNVNIQNSIFKNNLDFSKAYFSDPVNFYGTRFNETADFSGSYFNETADFSRSTFNALANFLLAAYSDCSNFDYYFNMGNIIISYGTFFNDSAYFSGSTFNAPAVFFESTFNETAYFSGSTFNASVHLIGLNFNEAADFSGSTFSKDADFSGSTFNKDADFSKSTFNKDADFSRSTFNENARIDGPNKFKKIITNDGKTCDLFQRYYRNEARYVDADTIYYDYRKTAQNKKDLTDPSKLIDILSDITCGYGVRLTNTIYCIIRILIIFSFLYGVGLRYYQLSDTIEKKTWMSNLEPVLLSIRGFTTLGSGDLYSKNYFFRILITVEGLLGWIMLGIFMATLTSMMIRP